MGTEFSACKIGTDRTNVMASVMPSLSAWCELLLPTKNSGVLLKCLYFGCTQMRTGLWDRIGCFCLFVCCCCFRKLKSECAADTV